MLPFPLLGIDVDNDSAFMNAPLETWCEKHRPRIELTRSRAYQSNDHAWVEQKNGMLVRRVAGPLMAKGHGGLLLAKPGRQGRRKASQRDARAPVILEVRIGHPHRR